MISGLFAGLQNDSAWRIDRQIQMGVYGKVVATGLIPICYVLAVINRWKNHTTQVL